MAVTTVVGQHSSSASDKDYNAPSDQSIATTGGAATGSGGGGGGGGLSSWTHRHSTPQMSATVQSPHHRPATAPLHTYTDRRLQQLRATADDSDSMHRFKYVSSLAAHALRVAWIACVSLSLS